jgi:hypothetical protein
VLHYTIECYRTSHSFGNVVAQSFHVLYVAALSMSKRTSSHIPGCSISLCLVIAVDVEELLKNR